MKYWADALNNNEGYRVEMELVRVVDHMVGTAMLYGLWGAESVPLTPAVVGEVRTTVKGSTVEVHLGDELLMVANDWSLDVERGAV